MTQSAQGQLTNVEYRVTNLRFDIRQSTLDI